MLFLKVFPSMPRSSRWCLDELAVVWKMILKCICVLQNCVARALYDNIAESPDELAFRKGDTLTVLEQNTGGIEGWWLCSLRGRQVRLLSKFFLILHLSRVFLHLVLVFLPSFCLFVVLNLCPFRLFSFIAKCNGIL